MPPGRTARKEMEVITPEQELKDTIASLSADNDRLKEDTTALGLEADQLKEALATAKEEQEGAQEESDGNTDRRPTIEELEAILGKDDETSIEILPNGEVRVERRPLPNDSVKPITFRDNLGGEYTLDAAKEKA